MPQGERLLAAEALARSVDLYLIDVSRPGLRVRGGVLEIGPGTSPDEIATCACRRLLLSRGIRDEAAVKAEVHRHGFQCVGGKLHLVAVVG